MNVPLIMTPAPVPAPAPAPAPATAKEDLTPIQLLIKETLHIPDHLTSKFNSGDIRVAYARYLAIGDARRRLSKLSTDGTWTQKLPTLQDVAGLFGGKSTYWNHCDVFAEVPKFPVVEKWLLNEDDAPPDAVLWGSKRPTYQKLKELVKAKETKGKGKSKKGKKRQENSPVEDSSEEMTDKKGKGKKRSDGEKKGSSSKSYHL